MTTDRPVPAPARLTRPGTLLLVPAPLTQGEPQRPWLCEDDRRRVAALTRFYVETPKVARGWLRALPVDGPIQALDIRALPDPRGPVDWAGWLAPLEAGHDVGLMSDAGCPGVADPGAAVVAAAQAAGLPVVPLIGPSAILLGLMASGLTGQRFAFHGYLPVARDARERQLGELARRSAERDETQILIETPYRNDAMADSLLTALPAAALLCIAQDLTGPAQSVVTRRIADWRRHRPAPDRRLPAVFLFHCPAGGLTSTATQARAPGRPPRRATPRGGGRPARAD